MKNFVDVGVTNRAVLGVSAFIGAFLLVSTFALMASGADRGDSRTSEANRLFAQLADNTKQLERTYATGSELVADYKRYQATKDLLDKAKANYLDQHEALEVEAAGNKQAIEEHNRRCPGGSSTDRAYVDSCNSEAGLLNAERSRLSNRAQALDETRVGLIGRYRDLSDATLNWVQKRKLNLDHYRDLLNARKQILARLGALREQASDCKRLLRQRGQGSDEYVKNQCGNVRFDGTDPDLPPPPPDPPSE